MAKVSPCGLNRRHQGKNFGDRILFGNFGLTESIIHDLWKGRKLWLKIVADFGVSI